jgi:hypothetical protein
MLAAAFLVVRCVCQAIFCFGYTIDAILKIPPIAVINPDAFK